MKPVPDIIVVGTDTGVGKSVVSLMLMQLFHDRGYTPFYLKPFQTGCVDPYDTDSDAAFVYRHTAALKDRDPCPSVIHCYPSAKAPLFAARDAGQRIHPDTVQKMIEQKRSDHTPLVVEAAGGLMVPVTDDKTVLDLIPMTQCRPLLAARVGLGTINHTLLSIEVLRQREIDLLGVVFITSGDTATDPTMIAENMEAIEIFSGIQVGGVIPMLNDFSAPPAHAYGPLENILFKHDATVGFGQSS
ncbi:MAG: dethiobiotin synthase [Desulfobacteraceae bacterium]|jgi:dethiobiotin synthetase